MTWDFIVVNGTKQLKLYMFSLCSLFSQKDGVSSALRSFIDKIISKKLLDGL